MEIGNRAKKLDPMSLVVIQANLSLNKHENWLDMYWNGISDSTHQHTMLSSVADNSQSEQNVSLGVEDGNVYIHIVTEISSSRSQP